MLRRTLLVLPTTIGLLLGMSLPAEAQSCDERAWTWDRLNNRWVRTRTTVTEPCRETSTSVGQVRFEEGPYVNPRAPRAWQPASTPVRVTVTSECAPTPVAPGRTWQPQETRQQSCLPIPMAEPCAPATPTCAPREWRPTQPAAPQPARYVPRDWRSALSSHDLLDAHRRLLCATDCAARRLVILEIARQWTVTVDQVITLVGALPTSAERLEALTALHAATSDASCYARTYRLLSDDDQCTLHVRITRTFDARTAAQNERLQRLRREEQQLQRVLGDD